jgi:hypothetical protein
MSDSHQALLREQLRPSLDCGLSALIDESLAAHPPTPPLWLGYTGSANLYATADYHSEDPSTGKGCTVIGIRLAPIEPVLEQVDTGLHLSVDFILTNTAPKSFEIQEIVFEIFDAADSLSLRRVLNTNGIRPAVETLGNLVVEQDASLTVFNPFHTLPQDVDCSTIKCSFRLAADDEEEIEEEIVFHPMLYEAKTALKLPMKSCVMVHDGHDYLSHHRRVDLCHPILRDTMGLRTNSGRFAVDFCRADPSGSLFSGSGKSERDWFGFGESILAPGDGTVAACHDDLPDNVLGVRDFDFGQALEDPDKMMGNHVLLDHGNGEYSLLAHLLCGSVTVKLGDEVGTGQEIGKLGFSGSTGPWVHLHYELRNGIDLRTSEGLPATFVCFTRHRGEVAMPVTRGTLSTGDIVELQC